MEQKKFLTIHNLTCSYDKQSTPIFRNLRAAITKPCLTAIVGPNGVGKSTLLKAIMGFLKPVSGSIHLFGTSIEESRHHVAYIPQLQDIDWNFPLSALDVTLMGLYPRIGVGGFIRRHHREEALHWLGKTNMAEHASQPIGDLSGGQRQRVLIARSLAMQAQFYILDEPYNGIDVASRRIINQLFQTMCQNGVAILAVHHDLANIGDFFDDAWLMSPRTMRSGRCSDILTPAHIAEAYGFAL